MALLIHISEQKAVRARDVKPASLKGKKEEKGAKL